MENPRKYGKAPFTVAVVHGGPGVPGGMAPVARELSIALGTLEPLQTLPSIEGQLQELHSILTIHGNLPITLIGHSWGAHLSYIFAARHPMFVKRLILIGSPPFQEKYASRIMKTRLSRLNEGERIQVHTLTEALNDPGVIDKDATLARFGELMLKVDSFNPQPSPGNELGCQYDIYQSVCKEARALRHSGKLLELGKQIKCPVIAIHGDYDPHPFEGIENPLSRTVKDFRLILLKDCGHYPWMEQTAKERFYEILKEELS